MRLHTACTGADAQIRLLDEAGWAHWQGRSTVKNLSCVAGRDVQGAPHLSLPEFHQQASVLRAVRHKFAASFLGGECSEADLLATSRPTRPATPAEERSAVTRTVFVSGEVEAVSEDAQKALDDAILLEQRVHRILKISKRSAQIAYGAFTICLGMAALTFINAFVDLSNARSNRAEVEEVEEWLDDSGWPAHLDAVKEGAESDGPRPSTSTEA
mmetsp:Transcript_22333/g.51169  ORF Transcript_22333/g.51169 Transcript_22333/m.51169 type:complete len:214 (+) Transcript_22333:39-680(+)